MPVKFLDCPYCGRGLLEIAYRAHVDEHLVRIDTANFPGKERKKWVGKSGDRDKKSLARRTPQANNADTGGNKPVPVPAPEMRSAAPPKESARAMQRPGAVSNEPDKRQRAHSKVNGVSANAMVRMVQTERREDVEWQLAQLAKSELLRKTPQPRHFSSYSNAKPHANEHVDQGQRAMAAKNKAKFVTVSTTCSCNGEFENCFKCGGSGIEVKQLATKPGCDTTLFSKSNGASRLAGLANDSRGNPFILREKGTFDSRPLHDAYDDESLP